MQNSLAENNFPKKTVASNHNCYHHPLFQKASAEPLFLSFAPGWVLL
jgi:hypothetical protein